MDAGESFNLCPLYPLDTLWAPPIHFQVYGSRQDPGLLYEAGTSSGCHLNTPSSLCQAGTMLINELNVKKPGGSSSRPHSL